MNKSQPIKLRKLRLIITLVVSILIFSLLIWNYFHGGVASHHILDKKNLPAISNWWSGIWLPILTWILLTRIKNKIEKQTDSGGQYKSLMTNILVRFAIGLIFGIILSVSFIYNFKPFLDNVLYLLLIISFLIPIFFSEFMLGFVLGMTYVFGAILPTAFILIMAVGGFVIYRLIRPLIIKIAARMFGNRSTQSPNK
jgi:hypothetical protein